MAQALVQAPDDTASEVPVKSVARQLGALTRDVLGCRGVSMIGLTPPDHLRPLVCVGLSAEHEEVWRERITRWPRDTDLFRALGTRLRAGETVLIDTTQPEYQAMANPFGIERYLLAPMRVGAALVGVLAIDDGPAVPDPDQVALVEAVAQLAGLVLERERLQREREEARSNALALREANRRMDEFLGIAGHEMRTPLTSSIGYTQLVQLRLGRLRARHDVLPAVARALGEVHHLLDRSNTALERLSILVNDLLDVSRIQAGLLQVRPQRCNLAEVVRAVIDEQRELSATRTILLDLPDAPVPVQADAARIGQVVTNYLSNALKYSAEDQPVNVGLDIVGMQARVWVRDEGPGVAPEERERIWGRFHRTPVGRARDAGGAGLGLAIVRAIAEAHGGSAFADASPLGGARVGIELPA
jgi:signal transduction histidine kinase